MTSLPTVMVVLLLLAGVSALEDDAEKRDSRDSYLDAYVDSQGSAPAEKDSPPAGVVEPASTPDPTDTYDTLPGPSSYHHQYPPTAGYSTMAYSAPTYKAPVLPPNSFNPSSYGVPIHPALPLDYGMPSPSYGKPSSYSHSAPPNPHPAPTYSQPAPTYNQPPPTYNQPPPTYNQPPPTYHQPPPSYTSPAPAFGGYHYTPAPKYGPPAHSYGPPSPTYGTPDKVPHPMTSYGPPDRGMVICVLLFLPKFDLGHGHKDDEMRRSSIDYAMNEKLDSLTKAVTEGIGREFDKDDCEGDAMCRLAQMSKKVDRQYTLMRLMTIFIHEYFDDDQRPDTSPAVPTFF